MARDQQQQRREGDLERSLRDRVRDHDADQHPERRERSDQQAVAQPDVAVAVLSPGAGGGDRDDREQRGRLGADLRLVEEDGEREATGSSLLAILVIGAFGAAAQAAYGNVDLLKAAVVGVPAVGGVLAGTALQQRVRESAISLLFAALLVVVAVELLVG